MLKWACFLHEIGLVINHNNVHKHSAYIIANSTLAGFDSEQQHLLSVLMYFHQKGFKRTEIKRINRYKNRDILSLLRIFRLAVLLNRARQATIRPKELKLSVADNDWKLQFEPDFLTQNPLVFADLEEEKKLLAQIDCGLQAV